MTRKVSFRNTGVASDIVPVTPNNSTDNTPAQTFALRVTVGGTVVVNTATGDDRTFAMADNETIYLAVKRVKVTGTTATGIHALVG